jgi:hypothetical protein
MKVLQSVLYGTTPEEIINDSLVGFVEDKIVNGQSFSIKSIPINAHPRDSKSVVGFYSRYGIAYISNLDLKTGLVGIDVSNKKLLFSKFDFPHFSHRDSYVYSNSLCETYVRENYVDVINEFTSNGYEIFKFNDVGDYKKLVHLEELSEKYIGEKISLDNLL